MTAGRWGTNIKKRSPRSRARTTRKSNRGEASQRGRKKGVFQRGKHGRWTSHPRKGDRKSKGTPSFYERKRKVLDVRRGADDLIEKEKGSRNLDSPTTIKEKRPNMILRGRRRTMVVGKGEKKSNSEEGKKRGQGCKFVGRSLRSIE